MTTHRFSPTIWYNTLGSHPAALTVESGDTVVTETLDAVVPYFDLTVGVLLIIGLFTRPAALVAAAFLASVFFSQFPPTPGPGSTYYHLVEMLALLVLAAVGAGRFLGIDYLFGGLKALCCPSKTATAGDDAK